MARYNAASACDISSLSEIDERAPATPTDATAPERRQNARLRVLVDEMLTSIRDAQRRDGWTEEERERAEADLDRIMAQVRRAATDKDR